MACNIMLPSNPPQKSRGERMFEMVVDQSNAYGRQLVEIFLSTMASARYPMVLKKKLNELNLINNMVVISDIDNVRSIIHSNNNLHSVKSRVTGEPITIPEKHSLIIDNFRVTLENKAAKNNSDLVDLINDLGDLGMVNGLETKKVKVKISITPIFSHAQPPGSLNDLHTRDIHILSCHTKTEIEVRGKDGFFISEEITSRKNEINLGIDTREIENHIHSTTLNIALKNGKVLEELIPALIEETIKKYLDGERSTGISPAAFDMSGSMGSDMITASSIATLKLYEEKVK